jgi:hypothetical protein
VYLFGARRYSTVVKLCDALLPVRDNGDYAKAALRELKAKALAAQAGEQVSCEPSDQMLLFNPYEEVWRGAGWHSEIMFVNAVVAWAASRQSKSSSASIQRLLFAGR